jgi:transcription elongation factor Elf1
MAALLFTCPKTKHRIPTGVETDLDSLRQLWSRTLRLACPHCGEEHEIRVREVYLDAALDDAVDRVRQTMGGEADNAELAR